jgi:hypothetical protein
MLRLMELLDDLRRLARERADAIGRGGHRQVAEAGGVHPTTFAAFLAGRRGLSLESAYDLAASLGFDLALVPKGEGKARKRP